MSERPPLTAEEAERLLDDAAEALSGAASRARAAEEGRARIAAQTALYEKLCEGAASEPLILPPWEDLLGVPSEQGFIIIDAELPLADGSHRRVQLEILPETDRFIVFVQYHLSDVLPKEGLIGPEDHDLVLKVQADWAELFAQALAPSSAAYEYYHQAGAALYECRYDLSECRNKDQFWFTPKVFRSRLEEEADRFAPEDGSSPQGWRAENIERAAFFSEAIRALLDLTYDLPRGRPASNDPNALYIRWVEERFGAKPPPPGERGWHELSPEREAWLARYVRRCAARLASQGITEEGIRRTWRNQDASRSRR